MSGNRGFLFNGTQFHSVNEPEYEDDSDFEDDDGSASAGDAPSAAAANHSHSKKHLAPSVPNFRDTSSKLKRGIGLPTLNASQRPNSAEEIRDLSLRSQLEESFWTDVDKMLNKRPPSWKHFSSDKQLPKMRNEIRAAKLKQHKRTGGPPKRTAVRRGSAGLDTKLLAEAQEYVARTCLQPTINSSKFLKSEHGRESKSAKSKKKGAPRKSKSKKYRKKPSSAPTSSYRSSINHRLAKGLNRSSSFKAAKAGKTIDIQALIENFQNGSTLQKLQRELAKSKQSKTESEKFISTAKSEWLS